MDKDTAGNPKVLGLLGMGIATLLFGLRNAGVIEPGVGTTAVLLSVYVLFGGFAQMFAGRLERKRGGAESPAAFTVFGLFWLVMAGAVVLPRLGWADTSPVDTTMWVWWAVWAAVFGALFLATGEERGVFQLLYVGLAAQFVLLWAADFFALQVVLMVAGYEGAICGAGALYAGLALLVNAGPGKTKVPMWSGGA